jgi:uncharacterized membrane protein
VNLNLSGNELQNAVVKAINVALGGKDDMIASLEQNIAMVLALEDETSMESIDAKLEELQQSTEVLDELQKHVDEKLSTTEENVHKECVKVYRNVQAVVVEENEKQTEAIAAKVKENLGGKLNGVLGVSIAAVVLTVADIVLHVLSILHIF